MSKTVVFSVSDFQSGVGHVVRIQTILSLLSHAGSSKDIEWVSIIAGDFSVFSRARTLEQEYTARGIRAHFIPFLLIPKFQYFYIWIFEIWLAIWMLIHYGRLARGLLWIEMSLSIWPLLIYLMLSRAKIIVDIHGTVEEKIQYPKGHGFFQPISYLVQEFYEISAIFKADGLVFVSERMKEHFRIKYRRLPDHLAIFRIHIDPILFSFSCDQRQAIRARLGLEDAFVFVYSGGLQAWQNVDEMLKLFGQIQQRASASQLKTGLLFLTWEDPHKISEKARRLGVDPAGLHIYRAEREEVPGYLSSADCALLLREAASTNLVSSPTKAGEYLLCGLPILCTPWVGDISEIVSSTSTGYLVNDSSCDLDPLLTWVTAVRQDRDRLSDRCRQIGLQYFGSQDSTPISDLVSTLMMQNDKG